MEGIGYESKPANVRRKTGDRMERLFGGRMATTTGSESLTSGLTAANQFSLDELNLLRGITESGGQPFNLYFLWTAAKNEHGRRRAPLGYQVLSTDRPSEH
jgi:hypothetical protein